MSIQHAIIIAGSPGCGKTTIAQFLCCKLERNGYPCLRIEIDKIRNRLPGDNTTEKNWLPIALQIFNLHKHINDFVIFDGLFPDIDMILSLKETIPHFHSFLLEAPFDVCVKRNSNRANTYDILGFAEMKKLWNLLGRTGEWIRINTDMKPVDIVNKLYSLIIQ